MLKKLLHYYKNLFNKNSTKNSNQLGINIILKSNYDIDILLSYPDINTMDMNSIQNMAEKYAELVMYASSSAMKYKLFSILQDKAYSSENIKNKLFFDNVCSFYEIIKQEIKNNQNNGPLIRPISVFNGK
jgi:hypothetical protein